MHMHAALSYPEFALQASPNLTEVSKNGRKLNAGDSRRQAGGERL